jgi:hypothetical protein
MKKAAKNRKTGSEYTSAELSVTGKFYRVTTERGGKNSWLVSVDDIELL